MSLQDIIQRRSVLTAERQTRTADYTAFMQASAAEMARLADDETLTVGGLDLAKIERARRIITVQGEVTKPRRGFDGNGAGVRAAALAEAKADLADGGTLIGTRYFGVKNYDGFGDQRTDCGYGMGPRHGSIVFSIGLARELQQRVRKGPHLENDEIEDALYLLSALPKIEELRADLKAAA